MILTVLNSLRCFVHREKVNERRDDDVDDDNDNKSDFFRAVSCLIHDVSRRCEKERERKQQSNAFDGH